MFFSVAIAFWISFIMIYYVYWRDKKSRNKELFLKGSLYQSFLWSFIILVPVATVIAILLPTEPINMDFFYSHSERVIQGVESENVLESYFSKGLIILTEMNTLGFVSALLILIIWYRYIRGLDFYSKEKMGPTITVMVLSMLFTMFLTYPWSDLIHYIFSIDSNGNWFYHLFVIQSLGVGFVEESIKLLPVLIILLFSDIVDEPIDLIYYACLSASGFAFLENIIYFNDLSGAIVMGRALLSAVGHMVNSSIVVYGIILLKFHPEKENPLIPIYYFLLGCLIHGTYNFLLTAHQILLFVGFFAFVIQAWAIIINNTMNNSPYFDYKLEDAQNQRKKELSISLSIITVVSLIVNGFSIGQSEAIEYYIGSMMISASVILLYTSGITSFDLIQGYWRPVKFTLTNPNYKALPGMRGVSTLSTLWTENTITPMNIVGKNIIVSSPRYNKRLLQILTSIRGLITKRLILEVSKKSTDSAWFLVQLEQPLNIVSDYEAQFILIRPKNTSFSLAHDTDIECVLKFIPKNVDPLNEKSLKAYFSYGSILMNENNSNC